MKKLIILFTILIMPLLVNASDVYYCSEDEKTGYDFSENFEETSFKTDKFKIMIDFDNAKVLSEKLWFKSSDPQKCLYKNSDKTLYCLNMGSAFSINKLTSKFLYADIYIAKGVDNDPRISHGTCEKF